MNKLYIVYLVSLLEKFVSLKIILHNILGYTKSSSKEKEEGTKRQKAKR